MKKLHAPAVFVGGLFLAYIGLNLIASGLSKHRQDGSGHLDLLIPGAIFLLVAIACLLKSLAARERVEGQR